MNCISNGIFNGIHDLLEVIFYIVKFMFCIVSLIHCLRVTVPNLFMIVLCRAAKKGMTLARNWKFVIADHLWALFLLSDLNVFLIDLPEINDLHNR